MGRDPEPTTASAVADGGYRPIYCPGLRLRIYSPARRGKG